MRAAGLVSLGSYVPAKPLSREFSRALSRFLEKHSRVQTEYTDTVRDQHVLPGKVETNFDGWESQPWFEAWRASLPPKKQKDPFLGTKERRRVPLDPRSVRESVVPHPMLSTEAEAIAGAMAIVQGEVRPEDIDLVLVHSQIPDELPSMAAAVQDMLQLPNAGAYGIDTCCSSFVTMVELAETLVRASVKKCVLLVGSHIASHVLDRSAYCCVRLGDGAVAGIVTQVEDDCGYVASHSTANGRVHDAVLMVRRPPELHRPTFLGPSREQAFVTFANMQACKVIADNTLEEMTGLVRGLLERAHRTRDDIDLFVTHQPVEWAGSAWCDALGIPLSKFYESYARYGNVGSASSGINLTEALEQRRARPGQHILIASSGAGENHVGLLERASPQLVHTMQRFPTA
ncbi:MAG: 3-oxoacyl-ACP synthase III family protein [Myxococcota bacterium]